MDPEDLPEEWQDFAKGLIYYTTSVMEVSAFAQDIARGDLSTTPLSPGNEVAPGLKSLQATLRHLTWQAQQIAKGDYRQRISFMGAFSEALNNMVVQLEERQTALETEIEHGERKSEALAMSLKVLEDITTQMSQLVIVLDRDTKEELLCNHPVESVLLEANTKDELYKWLYACVDTGSCTQQGREIELNSENGFQSFVVEGHPLSWGERNAAVFVFSDSTTTRRELSSLEKIANFDPQTKVSSRHHGMQVLSDMLDARIQFALCFIDMDYLKYVNDVYGHNEGDKYILEVATLLRKFSKEAFIARLGGDEFMLLAKGISESQAVERLEELRDQLKVDGQNSKPEYTHSISYGVIAVEPNNKMPTSELLSSADEKMYLYKRAHRIKRSD